MIGARRALQAAGGAPFDPEDIAGLVSWIDYQDSSCYTLGAASGGGNIISSLTNKAVGSVGNPTLTDTILYSPTGAATQNGFDGAKIELADRTGSGVSTAGPVTVFMVARPDTDSPSRSSPLEHDVGGNGLMVEFPNSNHETTFRLQEPSESWSFDFGSGLSTITPYAFGAKWDRTADGFNYTEDPSGIVQGQTSWTAKGSITSTPGSTATAIDMPDDQFRGVIFEWLVYDSLLSDADAVKVLNYLTDKWAL